MVVSHQLLTIVIVTLTFIVGYNIGAQVNLEGCVPESDAKKQ